MTPASFPRPRSPLVTALSALALLASASALARTSGPDALPEAVAVAGPTLAADGPPTDLITNDNRLALGIKNGPDSPAILWRTSSATYLVFSGMLQDASHGTFRLPFDPDLTKVAGPLARASIDVLMTTGRKGDLNPAGQNTGGVYTGFDRDYAGGGSILPCPEPSRATLYFYHGENHTDPAGKFHGGPLHGWTGIGLAYWDEGKKRFVKDDQIIGLGVSNEWRDAPDGPVTKQTPPASGVPSGFYKPEDGFIYVYYVDRTEEQPYTAGALACDRRACTAVARAPAKEVCANVSSGRHTDWKKFYRGKFSEPAVYRTAANGNPAGTGGRFTPAVPREKGTGENVPNVSYVASRKLYVMVAVRKPDGSLIARYSSDGLEWSEQSVLVGPPEKSVVNMYPRIQVTGSAANEKVILTYTRRTQDRYANAQLVRQPLRFVSK